MSTENGWMDDDDDCYHKPALVPSFLGNVEWLLQPLTSTPSCTLQAICVKDISPNLKSCELLRDGTGTFQCKADVFLTLDSLDCLSA